MRVRAHFNGQVFVPDEPVDLPVDQPVTVEVAPQATANDPTVADAKAVAAYRRLLARPVSGPPIPDEALRRENLYDDRRNRL